MSFDSPRRGDIPQISPQDPLPHVKPEGRWGEPYETGDGNWTCHLRKPMPGIGRRQGLLSSLVAADLETLAQLQLQQQQDEQAARLGVGLVRAYLHRANG